MTFSVAEFGVGDHWILHSIAITSFNDQLHASLHYRHYMLLVLVEMQSEMATVSTKSRGEDSRTYQGRKNHETVRRF